MNEVLDTKEGPYVEMKEEDITQSMMFLTKQTRMESFSDAKKSANLTPEQRHNR